MKWSLRSPWEILSSTLAASSNSKRPTRHTSLKSFQSSLISIDKLTVFLSIPKISLNFIVGMLCQMLHGTLPLLTYQKHASLKILITSSQNVRKWFDLPVALLWVVQSFQIATLVLIFFFPLLNLHNAKLSAEMLLGLLKTMKLNLFGKMPITAWTSSTISTVIPRLF